MTGTRRDTASTLLIADARATTAVDLFGQGLATLVGFAKLAPAAPATGTMKPVCAVPLGNVLVTRPIAALV